MMVDWSTYGNNENQMAGLGSGANDVGTYGGVVSPADIAALNKALTAGSDINNPGASPGEGFALRTESLDKTLFVTSYKAEDVKFWKRLFKDAAYNTVEEYNQLQEYGSGDSVFMTEGDLPGEDDSQYDRKYTKIKFMGTTRRITHVMQVVKAAHGDAMAREVVNGTLHLLKHLERALFQGDENLVNIQFDGLEALLLKAYGSDYMDDDQYAGWEMANNVMDLRGKPLSEDHINDMVASLSDEPNYGAPTDLWLPVQPTKDLSKIILPKGRYDALQAASGTAGVSIEKIKTPFGTIGLNPDIFIQTSYLPQAAGVGKSATRPRAVTIAVQPTSPVHNGTSKTYFKTADEGQYFYVVVAGSRYGKSEPITTAAITVAKGDRVEFNVTDNGPDTSYYEVYRTPVNKPATDARLIMRIRRKGASQKIIDLNRFLPGSSRGYILTFNNEVLKWKQLCPFTKMDLARTDTSTRWMQLLYGGLQVMKPRQCGMFFNIGKLETGANEPEAD